MPSWYESANDTIVITLRQVIAQEVKIPPETVEAVRKSTSFFFKSLGGLQKIVCWCHWHARHIAVCEAF